MVTNKEIENLAWDLICADMEGGLHQYDCWDQAPDRVKEQYLEKAAKLLTPVTEKVKSSGGSSSYYELPEGVP